VPLQAKSGTRIDVLAKPYILIPDYTFTIGMYSQPTEQGVIGEVIGSDWVGMKQQEIGQAQGWAYPADRTLILWEAYLHDWCRADDPRSDETLKTLWTGFEGFLLKHLSEHQIRRLRVQLGSRCTRKTKKHGLSSWKGWATVASMRRRSAKN